MELLLTIVVFILLLLLFKIGFSVLERSGWRSVRKTVEKYAIVDAPLLRDMDIRYQRKLSEIRILDKLLSHLPLVLKLDNIIQQSGVKILADVFIFLSLSSGFLARLLQKL